MFTKLLKHEETPPFGFKAQDFNFRLKKFHYNKFDSIATTATSGVKKDTIFSRKNCKHFLRVQRNNKTYVNLVLMKR